MTSSSRRLQVSVIICTHNPRSNYLVRVLDALRQQTLAVDAWELLLVDNASSVPLASSYDLSWHPRARHLLEMELGVVHAKTRGIRESEGELIVFVDDDNVLCPDYLDLALQIGNDHPYLGAWGGSIAGEFEIDPPDWAQPYLSLMAVRKVERDVWSNDLNHWPSQPPGAGSCIRRQVGERYVSDCLSNPKKQLLGRRGASLSSCEDSDITQTACKLGMGFGVFRQPTLTHLIPARRLTEDYLVSLLENMVFSEMVVRYNRGERVELPKNNLIEFLRPLYSLVRHKRRERRFYLAGFRANKAFAKWVHAQSSPSDQAGQAIHP